MFNRGRHDTHTQAHQAARHRLRKGIAKVALHEQVTGEPTRDAYGRPLHWAHEMATRQNIATVEKWARGGSVTTALKPSRRWCGHCKGLGADPFQPLSHRH